MTLLFCNVGWMEKYAGLDAGDTITGGGSWVKEEGMGHEVCNFSAHHGVLYGYVQPHGNYIRIDRLGASQEDESISGVTVVWTATRPTGGTVVVGWYQDATVYREYQEFTSAPPLHKRSGLPGFWIKAPENRAKLLSVDERTCEIPRAVKGGMGQANVWYADSPESAPIVTRVLGVLNGGKPEVRTNVGRGARQDQERKARIEQAAIRVCCEHFEKLGYSVESVEKDNLGWDLEAQSGRTCLRVEVKGLSGEAFSVELTPNEYKVFASQADDYRLAVVLKALADPELMVCRYSREQAKWLVNGQQGRSLEILTKQSASIKCT